MTAQIFHVMNPEKQIFRTSPCMMLYNSIIAPSTYGSKPNWNVTLLCNPNDPEGAAMMQYLQSAFDDMRKGAMWKAPFRKITQDSVMEDKTHQQLVAQLPSAIGMFVIKAKTNTQNAKGEPMRRPPVYGPIADLQTGESNQGEFKFDVDMMGNPPIDENTVARHQFEAGSLFKPGAIVTCLFGMGSYPSIDGGKPGMSLYLNGTMYYSPGPEIKLGGGGISMEQLSDGIPSGVDYASQFGQATAPAPQAAPTPNAGLQPQATVQQTVPANAMGAAPSQVPNGAQTQPGLTNTPPTTNQAGFGQQVPQGQPAPGQQGFAQIDPATGQPVQQVPQGQVAPGQQGGPLGGTPGF